MAEGEALQIQTEQMNDDQVLNDAGGYVWAVDNMMRLKRFIVMGTEGGTFYPTQEEPGMENARALMDLIEEGRGVEAVSVIKEYSVENRAAKQDPIILALAICARCSHQATKQAAYEAISDILRIPTHLFQFVEYCENISKMGRQKTTGWGRAQRNAISKWYNNKKARNLAMLVTKYKQRNNWSHRDLLRLCHIKPENAAIGFIVKYVVKGFDAIQEDAIKSDVGQDVRKICDFLSTIKTMDLKNEQEVAAAIRQHGLVREHIPTNLLKSKEVKFCLLK